MNALKNSKQIKLSPHFESAKPTAEIADSDYVGVKAAGLFRLPTSWTPPFFVIPTSFHDAWLKARPRSGRKLLSLFSSIRAELPGLIKSVTENGRFNLILRSSAENETLEERGQYKSTVYNPNGNYQTFCEGLREIYEQALKVMPTVRIAVVVQRYVRSESVGH